MSRIESPDLQLIELLRRSDAPTDEDMHRVGDAIGVKLAVGVGVSAALLAASRTSWAARLSALGTWTKGAVLATSLVGAGVGVTWLAKPEALLIGSPRHAYRPVLTDQELKSERSPADAAKTTVTASSATPAPESGSLPNQLESEPKGVRAKGANRPNSSTLEAEMELLGSAQRALKSGQPNDALRSLDDHARRFPSGVLALERTGVRTVALCQAGRLGEGRSAARSYLRLAPNSVLSKRIRIACQLSDE